jgi:hypothetical protein
MTAQPRARRPEQCMKHLASDNTVITDNQRVPVMTRVIDPLSESEYKS